MGYDQLRRLTQEPHVGDLQRLLTSLDRALPAHADQRRSQSDGAADVSEVCLYEDIGGVGGGCDRDRDSAMSRNQLRDWADLAEEQGWRVVSKPGGKYALYPPSGSVPPDLRALNITEPQGDQHRSYDNIRALLRRAGLKFPEDIARENRQIMASNPVHKTLPVPSSFAAARTPTKEPALDDLIAEAHQDINAAVDSLSKLGEKLGKIQTAARASTAGYDKLRALAQALKEI